MLFRNLLSVFILLCNLISIVAANTTKNTSFTDDIINVSNIRSNNGNRLLEPMNLYDLKENCVNSLEQKTNIFLTSSRRKNLRNRYIANFLSNPSHSNKTAGGMFHNGIYAHQFSCAQSKYNPKKEPWKIIIKKVDFRLLSDDISIKDIQRYHFQKNNLTEKVINRTKPRDENSNSK